LLEQPRRALAITDSSGFLSRKLRQQDGTQLTRPVAAVTGSHLPHELLGRVSNRIINEVRGINRVVYDISGKPPATIEWE
jgi:hypothetical protein